MVTIPVISMCLLTVFVSVFLILELQVGQFCMFNMNQIGGRGGSGVTLSLVFYIIWKWLGIGYFIRPGPELACFNSENELEVIFLNYSG